MAVKKVVAGTPMAGAGLRVAVLQPVRGSVAEAFAKLPHAPIVNVVVLLNTHLTAPMDSPSH